MTADQSRPCCAYCGKLLAIWTELVRAPMMKSCCWPVAGWSYQGNGRIVARRYADLLVRPDGLDAVRYHPSYKSAEYRGWTHERRLESVSTWDGERYGVAVWPFCGNRCVAAFARAAYRAGYRINAKEQAT